MKITYGLVSITIFIFVMSMVGFSNVNAVEYPPIIATDADGNNIRHAFLNQTIYFQSDVRISANEEQKMNVTTTIVNEDINLTVHKQTKEFQLLPDELVTLTWNFSSNKVGNYKTGIHIKHPLLNSGYSFSFLITDPQRNYEKLIIEIQDQFSDEKCPKLCFYPKVLKVNPETIVEWKNLGKGSYTVSTGNYIESDKGTSMTYDGRFQSDEFGSGESFSFLFTEPGEYEYFDWVHRRLNKGGIVYVTENSDSVDAADDDSWSNFWITGDYLTADEVSMYQIFQIPYKIIGGEVEKIEHEDASIMITIIANQDGTLETKIPRNIPYTNTGSEAAFPFLMIDGVEISDFEEHDKTECFRIFSIPFKSGAQMIELIGTVNLGSDPVRGIEVPSHCIIKPSPKEQIENGVEAENVICKNGFHLIFKSTDNSPACVKPATVEKLIERGWANS